MTTSVSTAFRRIVFVAGSAAIITSAVSAAGAASAGPRRAPISAPRSVSPRAVPTAQNLYAFMVNGVAYPWAPDPLSDYEGHGEGMIGAWYWLSPGYYQNYTIWQWLPGSGQGHEPYPWQCNPQPPQPWKGTNPPRYHIEVLNTAIPGPPVELLAAVDEQTSLAESGFDDVTIYRSDTPQPAICFKN